MAEYLLNTKPDNLPINTSKAGDKHYYKDTGELWVYDAQGVPKQYGGSIFCGDMNGAKIVNLSSGTDGTDAVNVGQLNALIQTAIYDSWDGEY